MSSKDKVLQYLQTNKDQFSSGEYLASELGFSRTAIWKAIKTLQKEGWQIEAVTNRGYRLIPDAPENDRLSAAEIAACLPEDYDLSLMHVLESTDSTNKQAKQMALEGAPHGTVVLADLQTDGNGHGSHVFASPRGGLYMSILLRPDAALQKRAANAADFTYSVAQTVSNVIRDVTGKETRVKPVNDLFLGDRKVCGILTEAGTDFDTGDILWLVIGIGINVSTRMEDLPEWVREKACSLYEGEPQAVSRNQLAGELIRRLTM